MLEDLSRRMAEGNLSWKGDRGLVNRVEWLRGVLEVGVGKRGCGNGARREMDLGDMELV